MTKSQNSSRTKARSTVQKSPAKRTVKASVPRVDQPVYQQPEPPLLPQEQPMLTENISPEELQYIQNDVHTFLSWHAPGRPFREHTKEYFINGILIMMAVEIILFLFTQYLLMMVVFSFVFFSFSLALVPPRQFYYKVSSEGIRVEDHFFIWEELYDFYFMEHNKEQVLHVRTKAFFPGELTITLGELTVDQVKNVLLHFLPYREYVKPTFMERAGDWLQRNFPLEKGY